MACFLLGNRAPLSRCMHRGKVAARRGVLIVQITDCRNQVITLTTLVSECNMMALLNGLAG